MDSQGHVLAVMRRLGGEATLAEVAAEGRMTYETVRRNMWKLHGTGYVRLRRPDMRKPSQWSLT